MINNRRIWLSLVGLAILTLLLWESPPTPLQELIAPPKPPQHPIAYFLNATTTQFDEAGLVNYTLDSQRMHFYKYTSPQKNSPDITLEKPFFTFFSHDETKPPWRLSSLNGYGHQQQDELLLKDNVLLIQHRKDEQPIRFSTSELLIHPQHRYAETDKAVIITESSGRTEATGMKVFLDDERIELLSNVKGIYQHQSMESIRLNRSTD